MSNVSPLCPMPSEPKIEEQSIWRRAGFVLFGLVMMSWPVIDLLDGSGGTGWGRSGPQYVLTGAPAYISAAGGFAFGLFVFTLGVLNRTPPKPIAAAGGMGLLVWFAILLYATVVL